MPTCRGTFGIAFKSSVQASKKHTAVVPLIPLKINELTPIQAFDGWWALRDDFAFNEGPNVACGSKVRQYLAMAEQSPGLPMVVGCSAFSAQQIYVADAAERTGRQAFVCVPKRAERTEATKWAASHGATITEISPGYPSVYRKAAKQIAIAHGGAVRWLPDLAVQDTIGQCWNIPAGVKRIVVPIGSGLVAAGILAGMARTKISVLGIAVSDLADRNEILEKAAKYVDDDVQLPPFEMIRHPLKYEQHVFACLPNGDRLDPYYAAKCLSYVRPGDLLWITGRRPIDAMPK